VNVSGTDSAAALRECRTSPLAGRRPGRKLNLLLAAMLVLCLARLWLMPLASSFWVDEMATAFVVRHGAAEPSLKVAPQVPASIYYVLPGIAERLFGGSEVAYRLPSVLAMAAGLLLIARIAAKLIHPDAAWFVAIVCLFLRDFNYQAADARPYALGTLVASASLWLLIRWLDSARWTDAILFVGVASLLWRVHLIFWPLYLVFALYTMVRLIGADTSVRWPKAAAVFALLGVALLPVLVQALSLFREAGAHVVAPPPSVADLARSLKPGLVAAVAAAAALMSLWFRKRLVVHAVSWAALSLVLGWWLCHPLCLFAFSRMTGNSVFLSRYLFVALPGVALAGTAIAAVFLPAQYWKPAAALGLAVLLFQGHWSHLWPAHHNSDWRAASRSLDSLSLGPDVPVICPSPFIEARPPVWRPDYPISSFLYSHLLVYRMSGKPYPFPFESSPEAEQFAAQLSKKTLSSSPRFVVYGGGRAVRFWTKWFGARPELAAWQSWRLGMFGDVEVVVFEKMHGVV